MMLRALNVCNVENGPKQLRRQWVANAFCVEQHREFACIGRPTTARRLRPPIESFFLLGFRTDR